MATTLAAKVYREYPAMVEIMEDIDSRFIIGLDPKVLADSKMIYFKIQKAFWYYKDHYEGVIKERKAPSMGLETFGQLLIEESAVLSSIYPHSLREKKFREWQEYLRRIPRLGAICINPGLDKVLMIQPFGRTRKCLQFPRGKLHAGEAHVKAAAREVWEECGIRLENLIDDSLFLESTIDGTLHKLYIVYPVMEELVPSIQCNKEIEEILWVPITQLPTSSGDAETHKSFFGVAPFVSAIRTFVNEMRSHKKLPKLDKQAVKILKRPQRDRVNSETTGWSFEDMMEANRKLAEQKVQQQSEFASALMNAFRQGWINGR
jgi:8-oxo-dGTP pyrophosphatase MutT (NUDIX family)